MNCESELKTPGSRPVLLSLIDDPHDALKDLQSIERFEIVQAPAELVASFDEYCKRGRTVYWIMSNYPALYTQIVKLERSANTGQQFDGLIIRNRNINTCAIYYLMNQFKEMGYNIVFAEQRRKTAGGNEFIPSYLITFDYR